MRWLILKYSAKKGVSYPFIFLLILMAVLVACGGGGDVEEQTAVPTLNQEEIALGKTVYDANCASCHGENLEGQLNWKVQNEDGSFRAPPHNEEGHTWHHPDSVLLEAILYGGDRLNSQNIGGTSNMPAYEDLLTDREITAVLTYIKSTWPEEIQRIQWERTQAQ